jgi:hypothetical protein
MTKKELRAELATVKAERDLARRAALDLNRTAQAKQEQCASH